VGWKEPVAAERCLWSIFAASWIVVPALRAALDLRGVLVQSSFVVTSPREVRCDDVGRAGPDPSVDFENAVH
jgi:hypothetical protein